MNVSLDIEQREINRLVRQVQAWQLEKRVQIIDLIEHTVHAIEREAESRAPVESGELRSKIRVHLKLVAAELAGYVIADVFYAKFIELGTSAIMAAPFMLPSFEANVQDFVINLLRILQK